MRRMSDATKPCPYCAEDIKAAARVCRYCYRDLPADDAAGDRIPSDDRALLEVIAGLRVDLRALIDELRNANRALLNAKEAGALLGVSDSKMYQLAREHTVPKVQIPGIAEIRFSRKTLLKVIDENETSVAG
jgi:predicted DNA-binding transcriptional regulator AlpA